MVNNIVAAIILVLCLSSCVGTKTLYKGITEEQSTLEYLYDSPLSSSAKFDTISITRPQIADTSFTEAGDLRKTKSFALPLILFNTWRNEHVYSLGKNVVKEELSPFMRTCFINEINRSTSLFADSAKSSDLTLEITVDSLGASGPYMSDGYVLFLLFVYSYSVGESVGPGTAYSKLSYVLKNREEILLSGRSSAHVATEPLINNFKNSEELRKFFSANLTEGLSNTVKINIEKIAADVEDYLISNEYRRGSVMKRL